MSAWQAAAKDEQLAVLWEQAPPSSTSTSCPAVSDAQLDGGGRGFTGFQATVLACRWPEEERVTQLLPLTGVLSLSLVSRGVFEVICWVVLWIAWASPRRMSVRWQ